MPGRLLPPRDAGNVESSGHPGSQDQIHPQQPRAQLSPDEEFAAEEDFASLYCAPIELYNIIRHRSKRSPPFVNRSLLYKIRARQQKRIHITISLSGDKNTELQAQSIFPLYVLLARPTSNISLDGHSPIYRFNRVCLLTSFSESGNKDNTEATFVIPDVFDLSTSHSCNLNFIFISSGQVGQTISEDNCSGNHVDGSSLQKLGGKCSWGKIPINLHASSLKNLVTLSLGHIVELASAVTMSPSFLEPKFLEQDSCLTFCSHKVDASSSYQLQVCISAQEAGARAMSLCPYNSYLYNDVFFSPNLYNDVSPSKLLEIISIRKGNVRFKYKYYNNTMERIEGTEDFSCALCLVRCGSFKGLRCHLNTSHDHFHFEFQVSEKYQTVYVSMKTAWSYECVGAGVDPCHQTFSYISKFRSRRLKDTTDKIKPVDSHIMASGLPDDVQAASEDDYAQGENGTSAAHPSIDPAHSLHGTGLLQPTVLQFGKTRKLSAERSDPRNRQLLQKRQFFHSHRAQPMALEQVFSDRDSEDEIDDDIADFEDKRMLDDFIGVTKDEKLMMHMWNSFVRKQRVIADGHVPWACESFSLLHGKQLVQNTALLWSWRLFMIKLWNHNLLDARTMDKCNRILQGFQEGGGSGSKKP